MNDSLNHNCNSVDLWEDNLHSVSIAVDQVRKSSICNNGKKHHLLTPTSLPPLTPIYKFESLQNKVINGNVTSAPKLRRINGKSSKPKISTLSKNPGNPVCEDILNSAVIKEENEEQNIEVIDSVPFNYTCSLQRIPHKTVYINKNNQMFKIVIPHNVIPAVDKGTGPVIVNIPGVGPLEIKLDPQVKQQSALKNSIENTVVFTNNIEPFSLNFDEILEKAANNHLLSDYASKHILKKTKTTKELSLNGFSKIEYTKAQKYARMLNLLLKRKRLALQRNIKLFHTYKKRSRTRNKVKSVKISQIVAESGNNTQIKSRNITRSLRNRKVIHVPNTYFDDYGSDLLAARKIIILNGENREDEKNTVILKTSNKKVGGSDKFQSLCNTKRPHTKAKTWKTEKSKQLIKPCFIRLERDEYVEALYKKYEKQNTNLYSFRKSIKTSIPILTEIPITNEFIQKETKFFEKVTTMFLQKLVDTKTKFKAQLDYTKPILILNESNFTMIKYSTEFVHSNIIIPVKSDREFSKLMMKNVHFISGVELGYIKLVDVDIFFAYIKGDIG